MIVLFQKSVEVLPDVGDTPHLDPLVNVEAANSLNHHLRYYPHGADTPDRRPEEVVRRLALVYLSLTVYQLETHDRIADETPVLSRTVHVGGENARDALGVMRR